MLVVVRLTCEYTYHSLWGRLRTIESLPGNNDATRAHHDLLVVCPAPPKQSCYLAVTCLWFVRTSRAATVLAAFQLQLLNFLDSRLCSIRVNRMRNGSPLQFTTQLEKRGPSLFVSFLESGMVRVITSHPSRLANTMGRYGFRAAFDSADVVVPIMARAVTMPLIGEGG
jgi:hypothetical protein